ncbi:MAG: L,D-transpeptidase family protein [Hyphomicrobiaceae bacterium]
MRSSSRLTAERPANIGLPITAARACLRIVATVPATLVLAATVVVSAPDAAEARRGSATQIMREPVSGDPLTIIISLDEQQLKVFDSSGLVAQSQISSGRQGYSTPTGIFTILQKNRQHYSNLYDSAPMPNMQRLTWSGVALHAGNLPGYPASHGCIRLPYSFSRSLFSMTKLGTRVIVREDMVEPHQFRHPRLFAALPPGVADVPHPVRRADAVATRSKAAGLSTVSAMLGVTPAAAAEAAIEIAARPEGETGAALPGTAATPPALRTRATALAERQAEIDLKATEITSREKLHGEAAAAMAEINERLNEARADLKASRNAVPSIKRDLQRKERAQAEAERELKRFIDRQQREKSRAEARAAKREEEHRADAASNLDTEALVARSGARTAEAQSDAAAQDAAAAEENELEAAYLEAIHDLETAQQFLQAKDDIIARRTHAAAAIVQERADMLKVYNETRSALDQARDDYKRAVAAVQQFPKPATVLISRRSGMLKIRQGHMDVYATPIKLSFPDARIGTHVFTAMAYADATETELKWQATTLTDETPELPRRPSRGAGTDDRGSSLPPAPTAANALERVEFTDEVKARISELIKPGSALIISDDNASPETGAHTDFIVQPRR